MPEFGEVRDFATGSVEAVVMNGYHGVYTTRMASEQRIWTGSKWVTYGSPEASEALNEMMKRNPLCVGSVA